MRFANPTSDLNGVSQQSRNRVVQLLADYLLGSKLFRCPGVDGATIEDIVTTEYPVAVKAGHVPGLASLASSHPHLAVELGTFFCHA